MFAFCRVLPWGMMLILLLLWLVIPVIVGVASTELAVLCLFWFLRWTYKLKILTLVLLYHVPRGGTVFPGYDEF